LVNSTESGADRCDHSGQSKPAEWLARDLKDLHEKFVIEPVTPLDMFPQTAETEVLVHLHA
jgi:hypothetical protein